MTGILSLELKQFLMMKLRVTLVKIDNVIMKVKTKKTQKDAISQLPVNEYEFRFPFHSKTDLLYGGKLTVVFCFII